MDSIIYKALVYKKTLVAAVAGGAAIFRLFVNGVSEADVQAAIAIAVGVALVYLARNNDPAV